MKGKAWLSILGIAAGATLALVFLLISGGTAGEYHVGGQLFCYDCHTMHYSMSHGWDASHTTPIAPGTNGSNGNWLGSTGPNERLLKMPVNDLCASCHDGQTFAPDVIGTNTNVIATAGGRSAGALNHVGGAGAGYEEWKGHTVGSTNPAPGYNPTLVGLTDPLPAGSELECVSCHSAHGSKASFRNLGPRSFSTNSTVRANFSPTYVIGAANDATKDIWINLPSYTAGSGNAATFNPFYAQANISFNKTFVNGSTLVGTLETSNRMGSFCAACHSNFHGGPTNTSTVAIGADFMRHPTAGVDVPSRYNNGRTTAPAAPPIARVRVFGDQPIGTPSTGSPGCITCHKAHGNQNPFGLIFLSQQATTVTEEGGFAPSQTATDAGTGLRNLCWQCHGMGATDAGF
ncbi:MAG TPA: hypothetical protein VLM91_18850 [Candidatus Methylomirabilis sp.]|nr:hypothetical protein [Candidatus Methylomirabilis sp.]